MRTYLRLDLERRLLDSDLSTRQKKIVKNSVQTIQNYDITWWNSFSTSRWLGSTVMRPDILSTKVSISIRLNDIQIFT